MLYKDIINLIDNEVTLNENGFPTATPTSRQVFADMKSIKQSEFYQSQMAGIKMDIAFNVRLVDYEGETFLSYNSKEYKVIRTYSKNGEFIELYCQAVV